MTPRLESGSDAHRRARLLGYFGLALVLLLLAIASQFRPSRPVREEPPASGDLDAFAARLAERPVHLVLIVIDTLRADRLGAYGYDRATSPHIDRLAARGIRFSNVEAQSSWTKTSMASLWTSLYPERTRVTRAYDALPDSALLPAERLRAAGYRTIGLWRNGWVAPTFGFGQGFDAYLRPTPAREARADARDRMRRGIARSGLAGTDRDLTRAALEFLRGAGETPFFLYLHYMDVHQYVYADDSPDFGVALSDLYDAAIHWTDRNVGEIVAGLAAHDLLDDSLIVVASDHGEAFGEHGEEGHARSLYRATQHTPLVIALPIALATPLVIDTPVANVDLWPTLFAWLGLEVGDDLDGHSLVPLVERAAASGADPPDPADDRLLIAQLDAHWARPDRESVPLVAARTREHRLHWRRGDGEKLELYANALDPDQERDLAAARPDRARALRDRVARRLREGDRLEAAARVDLAPDELARLRALGYVLPAWSPAFPETTRGAH